MQFAAESLEKSVFDVEVKIESVASNDRERDQTILSSDFFDVISFPSARFFASNFTRITHKNDSESKYEFLAKGTLTIKDISQPCELKFNVLKTSLGHNLIGTAKLDRHAWALGVGDWSDPTWVGSDVQVSVRVVSY